MTNSDEQVILLIGACGLDRLLTVTTFPNADSKIRTEAYHEVGGGNAANTASAIALLKSASFLSQHNLVVKLMTKVGDDYIGKQVVRQLQDTGVDLSSPLFQYAGQGTTTGFTTIIVSDRESTRTCIHTPGTCGELTLLDLKQLNLDQIFQNVIHLHSDLRHAEVALELAREARRRGLTVSVDAEKDRNNHFQHELQQLSTTLFTNSEQLEEYFEKYGRRLEQIQKRPGLRTSPTKIVCSSHFSVSPATREALASCIRPSLFYLHWFGDQQRNKEVIITRGSMGALKITPESFSDPLEEEKGDITTVIHVAEGGEFTVARSATRFLVNSTGVLKEVNIVDTTGAGDGFIGAYLACMVAEKTDIDLAMTLGAWVGGKKCEGPGARTALPTGDQVDRELGTTVREIKSRLSKLLCPFGEKGQIMTPESLE
jgi:sugar/nucleoside kinase (ribokinase family)